MTSRNPHDRRTVLKAICAGLCGPATVGLAGCLGDDDDPEATPTPTLDPIPTPTSEEEVEEVVTVTAEHQRANGGHYIFDLDREEIPAGWTTFTLDNLSGTTHHGLILKLPDAVVDGLDDFPGATLEERYVNAFYEPLQNAWNHWTAGEIPLWELFGMLTEEDSPYRQPDIVHLIEYIGGPGLVSSGEQSRTTVNLDPGRYMIECYVLDGDHQFHVAHGMLKGFEVTETESEMVEPEPTLEVTLSNENGLTVGFDSGEVQSGHHIFGVTIENNMIHEHGFFGHDVHLIRYEDGTDAEQVDAWMDVVDSDVYDDEFSGTYADRGAHVSTSENPGPATWLGGVHENLQGMDENFIVNEPYTAYFEADLEPGTHALISEIPDPLTKGFFIEFEVS